MIITDEKPLSVSLRESTAHAHGEAESTSFMTCLLGGGLDRAAVADYTAQLWFIYTALERAVCGNGHLPHLAQVMDRRLERLGALECDLMELFGLDWRTHLAPTSATLVYAGRLDELADRGDELGIIAHHYVRYLGDLAGGQVIARMLQRHYGISERGVNFYDFPLLGGIKPYRDAYRERLDALRLGGGEAARLIAEANRVFALNGAVFRDLQDRHCPPVEAR